MDHRTYIPNRQPDEIILRKFLSWVGDNNGPYGSLAYWIDFYLKGEDPNGKKENQIIQY